MIKGHLLELRDSIRRRGFWVDLIDGEFVLDSWYSRSNFEELAQLLTQYKLSIEIREKGIRVNSDSLTPNVFDQIEISSRDERQFSNAINSMPIMWRSEGETDLSIFQLDYGIAVLVFAFNKVGFETSMSCDGHGRREPNIWFNHPKYIEEIKGLLYAAPKENSFAYDWDIRKEGRGFVLFAVKRLANEHWDVRKVQDDVLSLSNFLIKKHSMNVISQK